MALARILILAASLATPAIATEAAPASAASERRLSPEEIDKVLNEAARKREGAKQEPVTDSDSAPMPVRGEVGFSIGTGGYRSAYGTAIVDLPGGGAAIMSLGTRRLPEHHFYFDR